MDPIRVNCGGKLEKLRLQRIDIKPGTARFVEQRKIILRH
jgi:hypothetical protein